MFHVEQRDRRDRDQTTPDVQAPETLDYAGPRPPREMSALAHFVAAVFWIAVSSSFRLLYGFGGDFGNDNCGAE